MGLTAGWAFPAAWRGAQLYLRSARIHHENRIQCDTMVYTEARENGANRPLRGSLQKRPDGLHIGDFSKEVCTGPHVSNTRDIGRFKIEKEQSSSAGVRRIRAVIS